jgi:hypothetical protein
MNALKKAVVLLSQRISLLEREHKDLDLGP